MVTVPTMTTGTRIMRLVLHKLQDDDLNVDVAGTDARRILVYFFQSFLNLITILNTNMVPVNLLFPGLFKYSLKNVLFLLLFNLSCHLRDKKKKL